MRETNYHRAARLRHEIFGVWGHLGYYDTSSRTRKKTLGDCEVLDFGYFCIGHIEQSLYSPYTYENRIISA